MKKLACIASVALALGFQNASHAQGVAAGLKIGTLGPGAEIVAYVAPRLNLRVSGAYLDFDYNTTVDTVDYSGNLHLASVTGLLDLHLFGGGFRVSGGMAFNDSKVDLVGKSKTATIKIGDNYYPSALVGEVQGDATFDQYAPYVGIGYGNAVGKDETFSFSFDLGVMFQGAAEINLKATGPAAALPEFQESMRKEEEDAQDTADKFKFYPVLSIGCCYKF